MRQYTRVFFLLVCSEALMVALIYGAGSSFYEVARVLTPDFMTISSFVVLLWVVLGLSVLGLLVCLAAWALSYDTEQTIRRAQLDQESMDRLCTEMAICRAEFIREERTAKTDMRSAASKLARWRSSLQYRAAQRRRRRLQHAFRRKVVRYASRNRFAVKSSLNAYGRELRAIVLESRKHLEQKAKRRASSRARTASKNTATA